MACLLHDILRCYSPREQHVWAGLCACLTPSMLLMNFVLFPVPPILIQYGAWFRFNVWLPIQQQMEKFKACEKEMKTKAFSKEGLIQAAKLDPKEQEKEEATSWLQTQVEELQMQVEQSEAEIEALQGAGKKRNKAGSSAAGRAEELETLNERRKWHISRLEIVLRLLNNGSMSPEKVFGLKEDVQYFVESNTVRYDMILIRTPSNVFCRGFRKRISTKTKVSMMTLISMKRKRNLALPLTTMTAMTLTISAKVKESVP
jgi:hypothetical protein